MKNNKNINKVEIEIPDDFSVPYPPQISPDEILNGRSSEKLTLKQPNNFFIYRKAFMKELKKRINIDNVSVTTLSPYISSSWAKEPKVVKEEYKKLSDKVGKLLESKRRENFTLILESPSWIVTSPPVPQELPYYRKNYYGCFDFNDLSKPQNFQETIADNYNSLYSNSLTLGFTRLNIEGSRTENTELVDNVKSKNKRQTSLSDESRGKTKSVKLSEIVEKTMKIDYSASDWTNIHLNFIPELKQNWINYGFDYQQVRDWIKAGFQPQDYDLVNFVQNILGYDVETVLNNANIGLESLRKAYERYLVQQEQNSAQIQISPKRNN